MSRLSILAGLMVPLVLVVILGAVLTDRWFLRPAEDRPEPSDAVIMLAGGEGERLVRARALADEGLAPVLVIMNGNAGSGRRLCRAGDLAYEVICPDNAGTTRGEARAIRALAADRGWRSIILVTSDFHLRRASSTVARCFDGTIHRVAAESDLGVGGTIWAVAREWAATGRDAVLRGC